MTPRKKDAEPLARERIVEAAMKIIDAEGLDALSMRRLGAELGVNPMAAYHYVPNKAALYDLVLEAVMAGVDTDGHRPGPALRRAAQAGGASLPRGDPRAPARHPRARDALAANGRGAAAGRAHPGHPLRRRPHAGRGAWPPWTVIAQYILGGAVGYYHHEFDARPASSASSRRWTRPSSPT